MQNIKKYFMTLALLIMATGAWAQTPGVKLFTVPAEWADDNTPLTAADLPADFVDYSTLPDEEAKAIPNPDPSYSHAIFLFYGFKENDVKYILWVDDTHVGNMTVSREDLYKETTGNHSKIYYTVEPTEWSLTPDETGKNWTLAKMPASNIELQVEYFAESNLFLSKDALADKANIAVKAGDLGVQFGDDGKSANTVTEGTEMTVKFNGTKKLLGMTVEKGGGEPVLLTTITAVDNSSFKSGSQTFDDVATVTLTGEWLTNDGSHGGWYCTGSNKTATISVAEANGANITSVKFYTAGGGSAEDKEAPFEVTTTSMSSSDITTYLNGNAIGSYGVSKIEVFGTK